MSNNTSEGAPAAAPTDSLQASLFKSLQLTVEDINKAKESVDGSPVPDTGVEVKSTIYDFSEGSGSLADKVSKINKDEAAGKLAPPVAPVVTPPVAPTTPEVVVPPTAVVTPPVVTPPVAPVPEAPRMKVHEMPKPFTTDDTILPPPPLPQLDTTGLDEDELEEVRTAQFAESRYPEKYKGYAQKQLDFLKRHKDFVKAQETENPDVSFGSDNEAYHKFLRANAPVVAGNERKRLERERLLDEAAAAAERRLSSKTRRLEEEIGQLRAAPVVERTMNDYKSLLKDIMPKEDDPIVTEAAEAMSKKALDAGKEFILLASNQKRYDSANDTHKWLAEFIKEQGELYKKSGHESLKRGSKTFVPRHEYNALPADKRDKHFSFSEEDVLQLIAVNAKAAAEYHSGNERERLKKAGYSRTVTATSAPVPPPVAPVPPQIDVSPRASSGVAPGTISDAPPQADPFLRFMHRG